MQPATNDTGRSVILSTTNSNAMEADQPSSKSKLFLFTDFNCSPTILFDESTFRCLEYQQELCPSTLRLHWQGWYALHKPSMVRTQRSKYPGVSIRKCSGTWEQNSAYCTKFESRVPHSSPTKFGEYPDPTKQGQRANWLDIRTKMESGMTVEQIIYENPYLATMTRALVTLSNIVRQRGSSNGFRPVITVYWVWGPPGVGKSSTCHRMSPGAYPTAIEPDGRIWFNMYSGQKTIIIDEVPSDADSPLLRRVLDHYPMYAPVKMGEPVLAEWTVVYLISNYPPPIKQSPIGDRISEVVMVEGQSFRRPRAERIINNRDLPIPVIPSFAREQTPAPVQTPGIIGAFSSDDETDEPAPYLYWPPEAQHQ